MFEVAGYYSLGILSYIMMEEYQKTNESLYWYTSIGCYFIGFILFRIFRELD